MGSDLKARKRNKGGKKKFKVRNTAEDRCWPSLSLSAAFRSSTLLHLNDRHQLSEGSSSSSSSGSVVIHRTKLECSTHTHTPNNSNADDYVVCHIIVMKGFVFTPTATLMVCVS